MAERGNSAGPAATAHPAAQPVPLVETLSKEDQNEYLIRSRIEIINIPLPSLVWRFQRRGQPRFRVPRVPPLSQW